MRSCHFWPRPKSPKLKLLFLVNMMWNKSESSKKTICQRVSLRDSFFTMHFSEFWCRFSLKYIVENLFSRETLWQMVFLGDSELFHIVETRKSSFSFRLFDLGWKYQGRTVGVPFHSTVLPNTFHFEHHLPGDFFQFLASLIQLDLKNGKKLWLSLRNVFGTKMDIWDALLYNLE